MSKPHDYWVYMMSNKTRSTLYIGVTNNLLVRVSQHRRGEILGFTKDYHWSFSSITRISGKFMMRLLGKSS